MFCRNPKHYTKRPRPCSFPRLTRLPLIKPSRSTSTVTPPGEQAVRGNAVMLLASNLVFTMHQWHKAAASYTPQHSTIFSNIKPDQSLLLSSASSSCWRVASHTCIWFSGQECVVTWKFYLTQAPMTQTAVRTFFFFFFVTIICTINVTGSMIGPVKKANLGCWHWKVNKRVWNSFCPWLSIPVSWRSNLHIICLFQTSRYTESGLAWK